ncbi:MAG TPA: hypothetical protein PJ994_05430, partial [Tepidiformaceae bacterium]|nr:hypothetical protein [Tepidiformaceae bacterium]
MSAPNNAGGIALATPTGTAAAVGAVVAAGNTGTGGATSPITVNSCALLPAGTAVAIGTTSLGTVSSCTGTALRVSSPLAAPAAAGSLVLIVSGVPFEGPYSLLDILGLAGQGLGGAALSNFDPGNIRDTTLGDGDVDAWDAPMPPAMLSIRIRGTGFLKPVFKSDVYSLGSPNTTTQLFPNPYYIQ